MIKKVSCIEKRCKTVLRKLSYALFFCLLSPLVAHAADSDFEGHVAIEVNKGFARVWEVSFSEELRFNHNLTNYARSETAATLNYTFARKYLKATVGYAFLNKDKGAYYDNRHRIYAQLTARDQFGNFKLAWRSRFQSTFANEATGDYKRNPKLYWRNRLTATYKLPNSKYSPYVSFEFFLSLNDAERNRIDALRSSVGCDYVLTRRSTLGAYLRMDNDIQVKERMNVFSLGVTYTYDF